MRQVAAAGRHWVRCVAVLSIALCHFLLAADSGGSREIPVTGIYLNSEYGYSVRIPENLHASRLAAPAPNHGFGITLRKEPESYIWTNGEYDALMIEDLDVLAHEEASALGDQGMKIVKITKSTLGGAEARDVTLAAGGDEGPYVRFILALRPVPGRVGIVLLVGLKQARRDPGVDHEFAAIVSAFKILRAIR